MYIVMRSRRDLEGSPPIPSALIVKNVLHLFPWQQKDFTQCKSDVTLITTKHAKKLLIPQDSWSSCNWNLLYRQWPMAQTRIPRPSEEGLRVSKCHRAHGSSCLNHSSLSLAHSSLPHMDFAFGFGVYVHVQEIVQQ